ncbi:macro domain-containing protein [Micromonospora chalcea]|uniref:macro domain-containing protein n=1 Tax=Micromonospora chalcea TaxID=1874 RepID=UPI003D75A9D1
MIFQQTELALGPPVVDVEGDLFAADVDALVNAVNCVGVMGKGIALQFRRRYDANFHAYSRACHNGDLRPGRVHIGPGDGGRVRYVVNFPTKRHWRDASRLDDIEAGLLDLAEWLRQGHVASIAAPALGCGLGGLDWATVRPLIVSTLGDTGARVLIYGPKS